MRLDELHDLLLQSEAWDWSQPPPHSQNRGFGAFGWINREDVDGYSPEWHPHRLLFRADVALSVEWGMRPDRFSRWHQDEALPPSWMDDHPWPDKSFRRSFLDVLLHGHSVLAFQIAYVSSEKVWVPEPEPMYGRSEDDLISEVLGHEVDRHALALLETAHQVEGASAALRSPKAYVQHKGWTLTEAER